MGILKRKIEKLQDGKRFKAIDYFHLASNKPSTTSMQLTGGFVNGQKDPYVINGLLRKGTRYSWNLVTKGGHVEPGFEPDSTRQAGDTTYLWYTPEDTGSKSIKIIPDEKKFNAIWNLFFDGKAK